MTKKISKKARAFQLFTEGKDASSQEVKDLHLSGSARYTYYWEWNKLGRPSGPETLSPKPVNKADAPSGKQIASTKSKTNLPGGESLASIVETGKPQQNEKLPEELKETPEEETEDKVEEAEKLKAEPGGEVEKPPKKVEGKAEKVEAPSGEGTQKIPTTILGEGLKVTVFLSIGTLALYQIASSVQAQHDGEGELELGEFLDTCAADYFRVRGKILGLITAGGK